MPCSDSPRSLWNCAWTLNPGRWAANCNALSPGRERERQPNLAGNPCCGMMFYRLRMKGGCYMIGMIDVGGGERGAYGAGVLDFCMERGIDFDYCVGVSAGAANLSSYLAGQVGRNFAFYTTYSFRPQYMGAGLAMPFSH